MIYMYLSSWLLQSHINVEILYVCKDAPNDYYMWLGGGPLAAGCIYVGTLEHCLNVLCTGRLQGPDGTSPRYEHFERYK